MDNMRPLFVYEQYDKICDDIMILGINTVLRFTVVLSKYNDRFGRSYFHKEFEYKTNTSNIPLVTIRRSYDFYLSIENIKNTEKHDKEFILIGINDLYVVQQKLNEASLWFTDERYAKLFASKKGEIVLAGKVNPIIIENLPMGKSLKLEPTIYVNTNGSQTGVRLYINSDKNFVDMPLNRFMGLLYILNSFNMYLAAQSMLNYLQRPDPGFNLTSFINGGNTQDIDSGYTVSRKIPKPSSVSFFNKMKELEEE